MGLRTGGLRNYSEILDVLLGWSLDDWEDGNLTSNRSEFGNPSFEDSQISTSDYSIASRQPWTLDNGTPNVSSGELIVSGSESCYTQDMGSISNVGQMLFELRYRQQGSMSTSGNNATLFGSGTTPDFNFEGGYDQYNWWYFQNGSYYLGDESNNARLIQSTHPNDTNYHTSKLTRDSSGNWELFLDGSSGGTTTDTTHTSAETVGFVNDSGTAFNYDWFRYG